jgi:hypothetical protein
MADESNFSARDSDKATELDAWLEQQMAGSISRPATGIQASTLELAAAMLDLAAESEPNPAFTDALERRLQALPVAAPARRPVQSDIEMPRRRPAMTKMLVVAALAVVTVGFLGLFAGEWLKDIGSRPVAAAELWERANVALTREADDAPYVYDRLELAWRPSGNVYENVLVEVWQSSGGTDWRYQLTNERGEVLYFLQRSDGEVWQSVHSQPLGAAPVSEVFAQTAGEEVPLPEGALLRRDAAVGWMDLDKMLSERAVACLDLYCLLGIGQEDVAVLAGVEEATWEDGRAVYLLEASLPLGFTRTLVLDRNSSRLIAVEDWDRGERISRLVHLDRQGMTTAELGETFFASLPVGLTLARTEEQVGADRLWIIHASPAPGSVVTATTRFEVVIGYELASLPEALIDVALARPDFRPGPGGRLPVVRGGRAEVNASGDEATISFTLGPEELQWLGEDRVEMALWVLMGHFSGAHEMSVVAGELFRDYQWTFVP